jgi:RNA polymerase sigma-70 factor (ECF subfamily)
VEEPSEDLVRRLRLGEAAAFDEAYARFHAPLYAFLARLLGRRDLAEDLAQETWMRLATHAGGLRPDTRLGAWLYTVARNLTLSFRRWGAFSKRRLAILHHREDVAAHGASPFELATASETQRRLEAALASLPEKYREVLLLVGVEGLPREDAAAILGLRPDALRQRLLRARGMIEERLGPAEAEVAAAAAAGLPETSR